MKLEDIAKGNIEEGTKPEEIFQKLAKNILELARVNGVLLKRIKELEKKVKQEDLLKRMGLQVSYWLYVAYVAAAQARKNVPEGVVLTMDMIRRTVEKMRIRERW